MFNLNDLSTASFKERMLIGAFDMGTRNFAFCVEYQPANNVQKVRPTYDVEGCPTREYQRCLDEIYSNGRLIECKRIDIIEYCKKRSITNLYLGLTMVLDEYGELWDSLDVILIEQQMSYGRNKSNIQALRLAQHCLSYFYCLYGPFKKIIEYPSTQKTRLLGCPNAQRRTHRLRKQFSIGLVNTILRARSDELYAYYSQIGKQDDVADCVLMIQAFKVKPV
jgi:hypothetical protein